MFHKVGKMFSKDRKEKVLVKKSSPYAKKYISILATFLLLSIIIVMSPVVVGRNYEIMEPELGKFSTITNKYYYSILDQEWNPKEEVVRIDFEITGKQALVSLANVKVEGRSFTVDNQKEPLESELLKVSDGNYVMYIKGVKKGFKVMRTDINPTFINEELEDDLDLIDAGFQVYLSEKNVNKNKDMVIEDQNKLLNEDLDQQIEIIKEEIEENESNIRKSYLRIDEEYKLIDSLNEEKLYQVTSDQEETDQVIAQRESKITNLRNDIVLSEEMIEELKERIKLTETKKVGEEFE